MADQAGVLVRPHTTREFVTTRIRADDNSVVTLTTGSAEMAFVEDGVTPGALDWTTAEIVNNGTEEVTVRLLVGPTGDTAAAKQLAAGHYVWITRFVRGTERPERRATLHLT